MSRPTIVCLCGSTKFIEAFQEANLRETIAGRIVLTIGYDTKKGLEGFRYLTSEAFAQLKARLDDLHKKKIDLADEILVLNVNGHIGESTRSEIAYAKARGKRVRYLESPAESQWVLTSDQIQI
jgi:hypothetical protein